MARHVLRNTGAVAFRAALESAVQVGRGNEGNRQAEMANPTKCRDSLQQMSASVSAVHNVHKNLEFVGHLSKSTATWSPSQDWVLPTKDTTPKPHGNSVETEQMLAVSFCSAPRRKR
jgi:hypothetical protein